MLQDFETGGSGKRLGLENLFLKDLGREVRWSNLLRHDESEPMLGLKRLVGTIFSKYQGILTSNIFPGGGSKQNLGRRENPRHDDTFRVIARDRPDRIG